MGLKYIISQKYEDPHLGTVHIRVLRNAVRFSARWKSDGLHITVPIKVTDAEYNRIIEAWREKLLSLKPLPKPGLYHDGYTFAVTDWSFTIRAVPGWRRHYVGWERIGTAEGIDTYIIKVSPLDDLSVPSMERAVGKALMHIAACLASHRLLSQARAEAERLNLSDKVRSWSVGRGLNRLGCCKASAEISLSALLMFFPPETRRSTILHELAHLTHFNHSSAFYALWEQYLGHPYTLHRPDSALAPLPPR